MELFSLSRVHVGMGSLLALLLLAAAPSHAARKAGRTSAGAEARAQRRAEFDGQLRAERQRFAARQKAERAAFKTGLAGRPAEEKKARLAEFNAAQKERLKAFREAQRARRREFEAGLEPGP